MRDTPISESAVLAVAGVWVSIVGTRMTAPGSWGRARTLLWRAVREWWVDGWPGRVGRLILRRPSPVDVSVGASWHVQVGSRGRIRYVVPTWPPVEWERTPWLHREVVRLIGEVNRLHDRMSDDARARDEAMADVHGRIAEVQERLGEQEYEHRTWQSHGLPVIVFGIVLGGLAGLGAWMIPWWPATVVIAFVAVWLAHRMHGRAAREADRPTAMAPAADDAPES